MHAAWPKNCGRRCDGAPFVGRAGLTVSAVVAESSSHPGDEPEDRVTEWINRAEAGLDEVRQHGGNTLMPLATP